MRRIDDATDLILSIVKTLRVVYCGIDYCSLLVDNVQSSKNLESLIIPNFRVMNRNLKLFCVTSFRWYSM